MIQNNITKLDQLINKIINLLEKELLSNSNEKNNIQLSKSITYIASKTLNILIQLDKIKKQYNIYNEVSDQDQEIIKQFLKKNEN